MKMKGDQFPESFPTPNDLLNGLKFWQLEQAKGQIEDEERFKELAKLYENGFEEIRTSMCLSFPDESIRIDWKQ